MKIDAERVEFLFHPPTADPDHQPAMRKHVERRELLGEVQRMALREDDDPGRKLDLRRDRGGVSEWNQRIGKRDVVPAGQLTVLRARVRHVRLRNDDVLDSPDRFEAELLGFVGERGKVVGTCERSRIGEHDSSFHFSTDGLLRRKSSIPAAYAIVQRASTSVSTGPAVTPTNDVSTAMAYFYRHRTTTFNSIGG